MGQKNVFQVKIVFVGASGVGKTCIISKYINNTFYPTNSSTIGANYFSKYVDFKDISFNINIWDTAGQELYKSLAPMYYRSSVASFVVFDVTNRQSFIDAKHWIKELRNNSPNTFIVLCGNKIDLPESKEKEREIEESEGVKLANSFGVKYVETSASTGVGIEQGFQIIYSYLVANPNIFTEQASLNEEKPNGDRSCC